MAIKSLREGVTADDFGGFRALLMHQNPYILNEPSLYVFSLDNCSIHKAKTLKPFLKNFRVLYNAPYSPFLIPREEFFRNWKFNFRRKATQSTIGIIDKITSAVQEIDEALLFFSFVHTMRFLEDCLDSKII